MQLNEYKKEILSNQNYGICPPPTKAQKGLDVLNNINND